MVGQGEALRLFYERRTKIQHQPFADVLAHYLVREPLELAEPGNHEEQADRDAQCGSGRAGRCRGEERQEIRWQGLRAEHRIDHDLPGHRVQKGDRAREQPDPEQARQVEPVRPGLAEQAPVQRELVHQGSPSRSRATAYRTVAMAAVHCSSVRHASSKAPRPMSRAAPQA